MGEELTKAYAKNKDSEVKGVLRAQETKQKDNLKLVGPFSSSANQPRMGSRIGHRIPQR